MTTLNTTERQVMEMLLAGDDASLAILRQQMTVLELASRKMTGVGFYTDFSVPLTAVRIPSYPSFSLGDVIGKSENAEHGLGFILFVSNGAISFLEGYTYNEPWPVNVKDLHLEYHPTPERDLTEIRKRIYSI